jgi:protocatechuate 3,4-dioxygenase beta subunit
LNEQEHHEWHPPLDKSISRRNLLGLVGNAVALALLSGCGGGGGGTTTGATGTGTTSTSTTTTTTTTTTAPTTDTVTPEGEIGPYFADDSASGFNRSNILSNLDGTDSQTGVPLTLTVFVFDSENGNAPVEGSQVDIWQCNPEGIYSDEASENSTTETWLRGYQLTDATGQVQFVTILPGWYAGRTTHIHLRVRSSYSEASSTTDGTNTTQVFFAQSIIDELAQSISPYSAEGTNPTTNASDRVYAQQTLGENQLTLAGDVTSGFTATFNVYLPITVE